MEDSSLPPKVLLLRPSGMLCNTLFTKPQREKFAKELYAKLRCYAGHRGFEVKRTCGSGL